MLRLFEAEAQHPKVSRLSMGRKPYTWRLKTNHRQSFRRLPGRSVTIFGIGIINIMKLLIVSLSRNFDWLSSSFFFLHGLFIQNVFELVSFFLYIFLNKNYNLRKIIIIIVLFLVGFVCGCSRGRSHSRDIILLDELLDSHFLVVLVLHRLHWAAGNKHAEVANHFK